jgi:hypothetical protein
VFTRGSRYEPIADREHVAADGRIIRHKRIRFLPPAGGTPQASVETDDRPDLAAWRIAGDPEQFWRLCDANGVARPAELTAEPGRRLLVPGPEPGQ